MHPCLTVFCATKADIEMQAASSHCQHLLRSGLQIVNLILGLFPETRARRTTGAQVEQVQTI